MEAQNLHTGLPRKSQESDFRPGESEVPLRYSTENIKKEVGISGEKMSGSRLKVGLYGHMGSKCSQDRGKAAQRSRGLRGQMPRTPTLNQSCPELRNRGGSSQQEENQQGSAARIDKRAFQGKEQSKLLLGGQTQRGRELDRQADAQGDLL